MIRRKLVKFCILMILELVRCTKAIFQMPVSDNTDNKRGGRFIEVSRNITGEETIPCLLGTDEQINLRHIGSFSLRRGRPAIGVRAGNSISPQSNVGTQCTS